MTLQCPVFNTEENFFIHSSVHILYISVSRITGSGRHGKSYKNTTEEWSREIPVLRELF